MPPDSSSDQGRFVVLNDQPVEVAAEDLLGASATARGLVDLITDSRTATPFTIAIDAGWGMGKSSLMRLMRTELDQRGTPTAWFNAWTSGPDALEVLIKTVLLTFDRNIVRRAYHRLMRRRRVVGVLRVLFNLVVGASRVVPVVDRIWQELSVNAKARNEIRDVVREMAEDWVDNGSTGGRQLVVFVDDLDRCSGEVALTVCEAIKLYLDVPGLVFVIGCDQAVLDAKVRESGGSAAQAQDLLEKIVQVNYRTPAPDNELLLRLVDGFAVRSGTKHLLGTNLPALIARRTNRNPRRIKRLINSFVLEYNLSPQWQQIGASALVRVVLLQHYYPGFYRDVTEPANSDIIHEFLTYSRIRIECRAGQRPEAAEFFTAHEVTPPNSGAGPEDLLNSLRQLEQELPVSFPDLVADANFTSLVTELADEEHFEEIRDHLQHGRRAGAVGAEVPEPQVSGPAASLDDEDYELPFGGELSSPLPLHLPDAPRILWIDDDFGSDVLSFAGGTKAQVLEFAARAGIRIETISDPETARFVMRRAKPHLLISDINRGDNPNAGLDDLAALRSEGIYDGPVVFYTRRVTPSRIKRAEELGDVGITSDPDELQAWIERFTFRTVRDSVPPFLVQD
ncbi:P-loop NTPase fold protein [Saccharopolyspora sp. WRP15-2]|uniref:P-loop NTPase fold protein n=1 Tax=Saccharopolyspora oryzae TaxID=2997343 RepID=A0ABT4USP5_9PSEU|nr:P-loop NTPase fold protein [Saccharopolyspora oryzae]MDA3624144.1 P-loop NTPase fold protein [Saccharopolyspora oryzae]